MNSSVKLGWCRVNFNYFLDQDEVDFIISAVEQIATHGWRLLPLYVVCGLTGQYYYNNTDFNRFDVIRSIKELTFDNRKVEFVELPQSTEDRKTYLRKALEIYESAPKRVRAVLHRVRDFRKANMELPEGYEEERYYVYGTQVVRDLGITEEEWENRNVDKNAPTMLVEWASTTNHLSVPGLSFGVTKS